MNITDSFISNVHNFTNKKLEDKYIKIAKRCILDYLGVALAGSRMAKSKTLCFLNQFSNIEGKSTIIRMNNKTSIHNAVFINAFLAHIAELDDGHRYAALHPGAPVISVLLPFWENNKISNLDFIQGLIVGYEVAIVLGKSIQPYHKQQGYHATGTCGTIGTSLALASAMKFSKEQMKNSLSAAVTAAAGLLKVIEDDSELKPFNVGKAALSGLVSALTGFAGFKGPKDILGGQRGFFATMGDPQRIRFNEEMFTKSLMIDGIYLKPYAACRHCHPAIEAAIFLKKKYNITPEAIESIKVDTYDLAVFGHTHTNVNGISSAKMSTPFGVAVAFKYGKAGIKEFEENIISDEEVLNLAKKVRIESSDELSALVPEKRAAIMKVGLKAGQTYEQRVDYPKGEPENPLSDEELYKKYYDLALFGGLNDQKIDKLASLVDNFDKENKVDHFFTLIS